MGAILGIILKDVGKAVLIAVITSVIGKAVDNGKK